ncbi:hypothetical protein ABZV34_30005 [Streptomyces sp. NPDC005195]|uniref:hypothetical protein n=1 Tax=Streptomyces sp. NPDC005195 TaxID=3154561 RepID=UPI0033B6E0AB
MAGGPGEAGGQGAVTAERERASGQDATAEERDPVIGRQASARDGDARTGVGSGYARRSGSAAAPREHERAGRPGGGSAGYGHAEEAGVAAGVPEAASRRGAVGRGVAAHEEQAYYRPLWIEEPARRRRLPDPVRTAAVRAVLIISVTLIQAVTAFLSTMAESWLAFPMVLSSVASTVVATWAVLDVWVTRQVWNQRNGVVSEPSSTARALRRERRRARRQARTTKRAQERIQRRGGAGRLSHP